MKIVYSIVLGCVGVGLIADGRSRVSTAIDEHDFNPLVLKGSPYGEIIGMALQDPVHLLWHGGKGHEHVSVDGADCDVCGVDHSVDGEENYLKDKPLTAQLKLKMLRMENAIRQDNNPTGRSPYLIAFEKRKARDLMLYAYEMDPTNYGNYSAVAHFRENDKSLNGRKGLEYLSIRTLKACEGRTNDPEDCLTAAEAAHDILLNRSNSIKDGEFIHVSAEFDYFISKVRIFEDSMKRAQQEGRLSHYTQEKVDQMLTRHQHYAYSLREFKGKIDAAKLRTVKP